MQKRNRVDAANSDKIAPHFACGVSIEIHAAVTKAVGQADLSLSSIGRLIEEDPMLSQLVLEHVNSASNALRHPVESVRQAVALLGTERLKDYLSTIGHFALDEQPPTERPPTQKPTTRFDREVAGGE